MTREISLHNLNWVYVHRWPIKIAMGVLHLIAIISAINLINAMFGFHAYIELGVILLGGLSFYFSNEWWLSYARAAHFMLEHPEITTPSKVEK